MYGQPGDSPFQALPKSPNNYSFTINKTRFLVLIVFYAADNFVGKQLE